MNKDKWIRFICNSYKELKNVNTNLVDLDLTYYDCSDDFYNTFCDKEPRRLDEPEYLFFSDENFEREIELILKECIPLEYGVSSDGTNFNVEKNLPISTLIDSFENKGAEYVIEPNDEIYLPEIEGENVDEIRSHNKHYFVGDFADLKITFKVYVEMSI